MLRQLAVQCPQSYSFLLRKVIAIVKEQVLCKSPCAASVYLWTLATSTARAQPLTQ